MKRVGVVAMLRSEWNNLPFKQTAEDFTIGAYYRSKGDNFGVYRYNGVDSITLWSAFPVRFLEDW